MIAKATATNNRAVFLERLNEQALDHIGKGLARLEDFKIVARIHGDHEALEKFRRGLGKLLNELEGELDK